MTSIPCSHPLAARQGIHCRMCGSQVAPTPEEMRQMDLAGGVSIDYDYRRPLPVSNPVAVTGETKGESENCSHLDPLIRVRDSRANTYVCESCGTEFEGRPK